jgi:hypothetical protein
MRISRALIPTALAALFQLAAVLHPAGAALAAGPRYFMKLGEVEFAAGAVKVNVPRGEGGAEGVAADASKSTLDDKAGPMARDFLREALAKRPEVTLELGASLDDPAAVKAEVKRKNLRAYELTLRVLKQERSVKPPPAGKKFHLLEQNIRLSLVGVTFPEKLLALGGDGESTVQIEVGNPINERQESEVLTEALKDAIEQAVKQGMAKLIAGPPKAPKSPPRKPKAK